MALARPALGTARALAACVGLVLPWIAHAQVEGSSVSLSPHVGGYLFSGDERMDAGPVFGLGAGYSLDPHWSAEAVFDYVDSHSQEGAGDVDVYQYRAELLYHLIPDHRFVFFLAGGLGGVTFDPDREHSNSDFLVAYGFGAKVFLTRSLALRADARHVVSFGDTDNNFLGTLGLSWSFAGR